MRSSGISADHPVAEKHQDLLTVLSHLVAFDQLNVGKLAGCESISRHMQIHAAVKRNARNPNFLGTEMMVTSTLDSKGGVVTGELASWTAEQQNNKPSQ